MKKTTFALAAVALFSTVMAVSLATTANSAEPQKGHDSVTLLLNYKRIPAGDYIHIYDSTPLPIASGHLAIKVDCDEEGNGAVSAVVGVAPDLHIIDLTHEDNMVHEISTHGELCMYHMDLPPEDDMVVTDIAIMNTTPSDVRLGPTATVAVHVHSFGEAVEHGHGEEGEHEEEHGDGSMEMEEHG